MEVYVFGYNLDGQLSCNLEEITHLHSDIYEPVRVDLSRLEAETESQSMDNDVGSQTIGSFAENTLQVISSWNQLFYIKDGRVLLKGYHEDKTCQEIVLPLHQVRDISSGWDKTTMVDKTGRCYLWRRHACEQDPVTVKTEEGVHLSQVSVGGHSVAAVTVAGDMGYIEEKEKDVFLFCPMLSTVKVREVSCGKEHTLILSRIGQVFSLGLGSRGQLGHGDTLRHDEARVVEALDGVTMTTVAAGGWHSAAISDIGDLYVWGWNESGQLGLPCKQARSQSDRVKPSSSTGGGHGEDTQDPVNILTLPHLLELDDLDPNTEGQREEVTHVKVSCGSRHTASITECGQVYTWGWNGHGQLGHGDVLTRDTPTPVTYFSTHKVVGVAAGYWNTAVIVDTR